MTYNKFIAYSPFLIGVIFAIPFLVSFFGIEPLVIFLLSCLLSLPVGILWVIHQIRNKRDLSNLALWLYLIGLGSVISFNVLFWGFGYSINQDWVFIWFILGSILSLVIFLIIDLPLIVATLIKGGNTKGRTIAVLVLNLLSSILTFLILIFITSFSIGNLMMG